MKVGFILCIIDRSYSIIFPFYTNKYHDLHCWRPTVSHKIYPSLSVFYSTHLVFLWLGYTQHFLLLILFWIQTVPRMKYCIVWSAPVVLVCVPFLKILEKEVKSDIGLNRHVKLFTLLYKAFIMENFNLSEKISLERASLHI